MRSRTRTALCAAAATGALVLGTTLPGTTAYADPDDTGNPGQTSGARGDVRNVGPDYNDGKALSLSKGRSLRAQGRSSLQATGDPTEGAVKTWLALDDVAGSIYLKDYVLRGVGDHIQVWVAQDTAFPAGDCRTDIGLTDVTDEQVDSFVHEFDTNIYPIESEAFSVPPSLDGTGGGDLAGQLGLPADYWKVSADQSDDIVVLVDNVRDANFYDPTTPDGQTYIAGFFYSVFNNYLDRNIMTIDAYDWRNRTGANPPDDTSDPDFVACGAELGGGPLGTPRPHLYEGTFAHEYQHLLENYEDPDEESWINEGLSDWAQTLVGYVDPSIPADETGADSHLACIQGFSDPAFGGAENSLTEWSDQGGPEILCDYGAAYSFMEYLASHYGNDFMSALHREDGNGLAGLDAVLDDEDHGHRGRHHKRGHHDRTPSAMETVHDWAAALALDKAAGRSGKVHGAKKDVFSIASMNAQINWDNTQDYDSPGAPPNGSDYVRLRDRHGHYLSAHRLHSITFDGATTLEPTPVEWESVATPPDATSDATTCGNTGSGGGPAALYSGCGNMLDRSIVREVSVPEADPTLTFDALWDIEAGWDFAFVQVSTDGGKTWTSLSTPDTTSEADPGALTRVTDHLPGFTGDSGSWTTQTVDLSDYAGDDVLVGFRYITDPAATEAGMWVRNVAVGGTAVPEGLDGWQTITQVSPIPVAGYTVQLIGYDRHGRPYHHTMRLDRHFDGHLSGRKLDKAVGKHSSVVAAIVMQDAPDENVGQYARYTLKANGVVQPGG